MAIPAISATQVVQLGVATAALGSAVSRTFADLLKSAADLLAPQPAEKARDTSPGSASASGKDEFAVLRGQIEDLLSRFNDRVKTLLRGQGAREDSTKFEVTFNDDGTLQLPGNDAAQAADLEYLLADDETLATLFRQIVARKQLLTTATSPASMTGPRSSSSRG